MRRDVRGGVVEAAVPRGVGHEDLALGVPHGDGVGVGARAAGDGDDACDAGGEEGGGAQGEHAAHGGADGGVERGDAEVVEQAELAADHVVEGEDREAGGVGEAIAWVDGGGPGGPVAAAEHVGADDKELARVDGFPGADEFLPPPRLGVGGVGVRVGAGAEAGVQQDGVGFIRVERPPGLVGDGELWEDPAVVQEERGVGGEGLVCAGGVSWLRPGGGGGGVGGGRGGGGAGLEGLRAGFEGVEAGEGHLRVGAAGGEGGAGGEQAQGGGYPP